MADIRVETQRQIRTAEGLAFTWDAVPGAIRYGFIVGFPDLPVPPVDDIMRGATREFAIMGIPPKFTGAVDLGSPVGEERQYGLIAYRGDGSIVGVPGVRFTGARGAPRDREYHSLMPPDLVRTHPVVPAAPVAPAIPATPAEVAATADPWAALQQVEAVPPPAATPASPADPWAALQTTEEVLDEETPGPTPEVPAATFVSSTLYVQPQAAEPPAPPTSVEPAPVVEDPWDVLSTLSPDATYETVAPAAADVAGADAVAPTDDAVAVGEDAVGYSFAEPAPDVAAEDISVAPVTPEIELPVELAAGEGEAAARGEQGEAMARGEQGEQGEAPELVAAVAPGVDLHPETAASFPTPSTETETEAEHEEPGPAAAMESVTAPDAAWLEPPVVGESVAVDERADTGEPMPVATGPVIDESMPVAAGPTMEEEAPPVAAEPVVAGAEDEAPLVAVQHEWGDATSTLAAEPVEEPAQATEAARMEEPAPGMTAEPLPGPEEFAAAPAEEALAASIGQPLAAASETAEPIVEEPGASSTQPGASPMQMEGPGASPMQRESVAPVTPAAPVAESPTPTIEHEEQEGQEGMDVVEPAAASFHPIGEASAAEAPRDDGASASPHATPMDWLDQREAPAGEPGYPSHAEGVVEEYPASSPEVTPVMPEPEPSPSSAFEPEPFLSSAPDAEQPPAPVSEPEAPPFPLAGAEVPPEPAGATPPGDAPEPAVAASEPDFSYWSSEGDAEALRELAALLQPEERPVAAIEPEERPMAAVEDASAQPPETTPTVPVASETAEVAPLDPQVVASVAALLDEAELYLLPSWLDYGEAERLIAQAAELAPHDPRVRELRQRVAQERGGAGNGDADALLRDAREALDTGDHWRAVDLYEQVLSRQGDSAEARAGLERARIYGRWSAGRAAAESDPARLRALGDQFASDAPDLAAQVYADAFDREPSAGTLHAWLRALARGGDSDGVAAAARRGLQTLRSSNMIVVDDAQDRAVAALDGAADLPAAVETLVGTF